MITTLDPASSTRAVARQISGISIVGCIAVVLAGCESEPEPTPLSQWMEAVDGAGGQATNSDSLDESDRPVPSITGPHPRAVTPEIDFQFGKMRVGTHMSHEFEIINEGEAPLELVAGKATCKCTQFRVTPSTVAPGETGILVVEWHGKAETTTFSHGGPVYTNDPENRELRFNVGGTVDATITTRPQGTWDAGSIPGADPVVMTGTLFSRFLQDLSIDSVSTESDMSSVEYEPLTPAQLLSSEAKCGWTFRVTIRPEFPVGRLEDRLTVNISDLEEPVTVPISALRLGDIRFMPVKGTSLQAETRTLHLGQFPASEGRVGACILMVRRDSFAGDLQLLNVEASPRTLSVNLEPLGKPNQVFARYKLTVTIPPGGLRTERRKSNPATIRCRTNHPTEEELVLQVRYGAF